MEKYGDSVTRDSILCVLQKGSHTGSGGKVVKMFVAISYGKGVTFCEQYEKCDGTILPILFVEILENCLAWLLSSPPSPFQCCSLLL